MASAGSLWLSLLATRVTGAPVRVTLEDMHRALLGVAAHDGKTFTIRLNAALVQGGDAGELARVFWHEVGHVRLGHVLRRTQPHQSSAYENARDFVSLDVVPENERAADAFAADMLQKVPLADVWGLCWEGG